MKNEMMNLMRKRGGQSIQEGTSENLEEVKRDSDKLKGAGQYTTTRCETAPVLKLAGQLEMCLCLVWGPISPNLWRCAHNVWCSCSSSFLCCECDVWCSCSLNLFLCWKHDEGYVFKFAAEAIKISHDWRVGMPALWEWRMTRRNETRETTPVDETERLPRTTRQIEKELRDQCRCKLRREVTGGHADAKCLLSSGVIPTMVEPRAVHRLFSTCSLPVSCGYGATNQGQQTQRGTRGCMPKEATSGWWLQM